MEIGIKADFQFQDTSLAKLTLEFCKRYSRLVTACSSLEESLSLLDFKRRELTGELHFLYFKRRELTGEFHFLYFKRRELKGEFRFSHFKTTQTIKYPTKWRHT